jgi:hypothetical protein
MKNVITRRAGEVQHIVGKIFDKNYNFAFDLISIRGLHTKLWAPKVAGVLVVRILGLPLGNLKTKWHLGVGHVANHRVYYKGKGGGFPQVQVVVGLMSSSLLMAHPNTKNTPTMHWPTCCLVLCRSVWVIECLSFFLVPSQSSSTPLYPQSVASQGVCPQLLVLLLFSLQTHIWVYQRAWEHIMWTHIGIKSTPWNHNLTIKPIESSGNLYKCFRNCSKVLLPSLDSIPWNLEKLNNSHKQNNTNTLLLKLFPSQSL